MKRSLEIKKSNLSDDDVLIVVELVIDTSIIFPPGLVSMHKINKYFYSKWSDRKYGEGLFRNASKKSMELFSVTKHGAYLSNYFVVLSKAKVFGMLNMIWREIIEPLDTSLITEEEYHTGYRSNASREALTMGRLLGRKEKEGEITREERSMLINVRLLLKEKHGWVLDFENGYEKIVYIRSI